MTTLFLAIITFIILSVSLICFSCLSISHDCDSAYENYMRNKIITEIIETEE